jgi:hypothetical protein
MGTGATDCVSPVLFIAVRERSTKQWRDQAQADEQRCSADDHWSPCLSLKRARVLRAELS